MARSKYSMVDSGETFVLLQDWGPWDKHKTITNDAEMVVKEQAALGLGERRLFYHDSDNDLTELVHDGNGGFIDFKMARAEQLEDV